MGMVFCPADYTVNSNTGFSLLFSSWVISDNNSYYLACLGVAFLGACRQALVALRREILSANSGRSGGKGGDKFGLLGADVLSASGGEGPESTTGGGGKRRSGPFFFETKFLRTQPTILLVVDTILFACALGAAYFTMLVAMAYDFGLLFSLVLGESLCYALCRYLSGATKFVEEIEPSCCD